MIDIMDIQKLIIRGHQDLESLVLHTEATLAKRLSALCRLAGKNDEAVMKNMVSLSNSAVALN